ncbi:MAG: DNRLRE domain-containing protein [Myxococcales bacterium]|nr:DNRLRE domain-containing protein [Myxococcales bacterium]
MSRITLCATAVIAAGAWGGCGVESGDGDEAFAQADALTTTMSFQDGVAPSTSYAGTTDAVLQQASPTTNVGSDTTMRVDMDYPSGTGKAATAVLRFDLSAIPKASTIKSASLTINVTNATGGEGYTLYALNRAWDEPVVTWNTARAGSAWSPGGARGADHGSTPLGVLLPTTVGKYTLSLNADGVRVRRMPSEVEPRRALLHRTDAVLPIVGRNEIAARVADIRNLEVAHQLRHVAAHAVRVGGCVPGLVDARIDGAPQMLEKGAVKPVVDPGHNEIPVRRDRGTHCRQPPC